MFCDTLLQYFPFISEHKELRSSYIAICVFNNLLTYTAVILNIVTMHAIRKSSSWPKTTKTLLLSLAVSDVGVGLFVQPFYTSLLVSWLQKNSPTCFSYRMFSNVGLVFSQASFLGVVAVSVDRFLAVHLHLRYQELVTHKRVVAVVTSIWVLPFVHLCICFFYNIKWSACYTDRNAVHCSTNWSCCDHSGLY